MNRILVIGGLMSLVLAIVLTGCGPSGGSANLDGTQWVLKLLNGRSPIAGAQITLAFEAGQASGSAGCNSYFGTYRVQGADGLTLEDLANTEMACMDPAGIMEQEVEFLEALRSTTGFRLSEGELQISGAEGAVLLFSRVA